MDVDTIKILYSAIQSGNLKTVKLLIGSSKGMKYLNITNNERKTPLMEACEYGWVDIVEYLLSQKNIDCNFKNSSGLTALCISCLEKNIDIIQLLLNKGCNIDFRSAISSLDDINIFERLFLGGQLPGLDTNKDYKGFNLIHRAAVFDKRNDVLKRLINSGVDINLTDKYGHTPLILACINGAIINVKSLLEMGADTNVVDNDGQTVFEYAKIGGIDNVFLT